MTLTIVYRPKGAVAWTHRFRLHASQWHSFMTWARLYRSQGEYAIVRHRGPYTRVQA
jgi:hypothetical protein